jgi:hypothetical protein
MRFFFERKAQNRRVACHPIIAFPSSATMSEKTKATKKESTAEDSTVKGFTLAEVAKHKDGAKPDVWIILGNAKNGTHQRRPLAGNRVTRRAPKQAVPRSTTCPSTWMTIPEERK